MIKYVKQMFVGFLSALCLGTTAFGAYQMIDAQAEANQTAQLWEGFAITATAVRTEEPAGLRFKTDVERLTPSMKKYNPDAEYYTTLTFTTNGQEYMLMRNVDVWRSDGSGWNTVLLGIPESDYETVVTAQSFIKLNGKEEAFYKTEPVSISIAQTAAAAMSYGATSEYVTQYVEDIVTNVSLDITSGTLEKGQVLQLTATTTPTGYKAKFTSSDNDIASVDAKGKVTARKVGTATITAEINGYTATCQITVTETTEAINGFDGAASTQISVGGFSGDKTKDITTWFNGIFADESVDAITFDVTSDKSDTAVQTTGNLFNVELSANTTSHVTVTRTMYLIWQNSNSSKFELKILHDGGWLSSAKVTFNNFKKVCVGPVSRTLTQSELAALAGLMPDYSQNSSHFDFFGYSALSDGTGQEANEDFRNLYRIEEYRDVGMNVLFTQSEACIEEGLGDNFDFSTSKLKEVMDMAQKANLGKVILSDYRLAALSNRTESLIGSGKQFSSEAELDAKIKKWMSPYVKHGAFYGVILGDEPKYTQLTAYGQMYRAIKRCYPNAYIHCNLLPCTVNAITNNQMQSPSQELLTKYTNLGYRYPELLAAFEGYITTFLDATGADYFCYDSYPLSKTGVSELYIASMQVAVQVAKERKVNFRFVSQTFTDSGENAHILTEEDLRWLNNMQLGFGIDKLSYFTYFTRSENADNASFINRAGEKTEIYYAMREILAENQAFASTILNFDYQTSATYTGTSIYNNNPANNCIGGSFAKLDSISIVQESALVTELYDRNFGRYMYMVQNLVDPYHGTQMAYQTAKLTFNENYEYAIVWKNGEKSVVKLDNNAFVTKLMAGEAVYVIPFNPDESNQQDDKYLFDAAKGDNGINFGCFDKKNIP